LKVQKKDGTIENFDREKIKAGIVESGGTVDQAETITSQIETWAGTVAMDGVIKVSDIRTKLLELLGVADPAVKTAFENYKKP